jgi:hypothetical protein
MTLVPGSSRRLCLALALAALVAGCSGVGSPTLISVGERKLTVEDFKRIAGEPGMLDRYASVPDSLRKQALFDDLVDYETLAAAAMKAGIDKDSAFVKYQEEQEKKLLPDALYDAKIGTQTRVSDDEAKLFYDGQNTEYELAILMTTDSTVMASLVSRLARGEKFEDVARTGSQDPATAADGGKLGGWYTLGQFPPAVETALKPLEKGQRTGIITQRQGTFVFQVLDKRPRKDKPDFATQKEQIKQSLVQRKRGVLADQYLSGLKRGYDLKIGGDGWAVVNGVMTNAPDSLSRYVFTEPARVGITDEDRKLTLATWKGRTYTVGDMLVDLRNSEMQDRPPSNRADLFKVFLEGKAMSDILVREARKEGIDRDPKVKRQLEQLKTGYLVQSYLAKAVGMPSQPTLAELDSLTAVMVAASGGAPQNIHFQQLPPQAQQQVAQALQEEKQKQLVKQAIAKAKAELQPYVNEKALEAVEWPVEPEAQEKA